MLLKQREKRRELRESEDKGDEIKGRRRPLQEKLAEPTRLLKQAEQQLQGLDSRAGQQERKLRQASYDSHKAYEWLLNNQDKFEKEVFGPPIVTCSIKDPRYTNHVESLLQRTDYTAFTVQSRNDFRNLQRYLIRDLKLQDISIRTSSIPLGNLQAPLHDDQLRNMGFQGWAKDFLNGPEPVLAVLCSENRLHQTPISLRDISDQTYTALENSSITSWVAGKQAYQIVRRREYGPGASSTRVRQVRPAKVWTSQPVDTLAKGELQARIQELRDDIKNVEDEIESDRASLTELGREYEKVKRERVSLRYLYYLPDFANFPFRMNLKAKRQRSKLPTPTSEPSQNEYVGHAVFYSYPSR